MKSSPCLVFFRITARSRRVIKLLFHDSQPAAVLKVPHAPLDAHTPRRRVRRRRPRRPHRLGVPDGGMGTHTLLILWRQDACTPPCGWRNVAMDSDQAGD